MEVERRTIGRPLRRFPKNTEFIVARHDTSGAYKVDVSRGDKVVRMLSERFLQPDDDRYLSVDDLFVWVRSRAERIGVAQRAIVQRVEP